ncbi:Diphthamide biosynthesis protein 1 [Boothiomyces macroporosus]|uniref:2-(3-amino-3-carboxypropyl)histidine synthase subunit 1 n=1 Tax=Boothiomyces macroporosus TaxID=261099 RepID=A0AAD5Y710_9FUNG|nr:Diphthamide biosynthesis protein 1 [Boothiomyces macroporosus]
MAECENNCACSSEEKKKKPKRFIGKKSTGNKTALTTQPTKIVNSIPQALLEDEYLKELISALPSNYNFEIYKSIHQIQQYKPSRIALQFPEGLLVYSTAISDIILNFCGVECLIMGDVTYGACCIDDFTAIALGCDFMIHYGHSCLIPIDTTKIKTLYVFVDIGIDIQHFIDTVKYNVEVGKKICLVGTIQFVGSLGKCVEGLQGYEVVVPQSRPLSKGEILGCTAPKIEADVLVYLGDGRFHLEAIMIANPTIEAYRYDPYSKKYTRERYDHQEMYDIRSHAIEQAKKAKKIGLIQGTLGRQGSPKVMQYLESVLLEKGIEHVNILLSEIMPEKLSRFKDIDCFVQTSCPRLSIDWGYAFDKPLLTPYEAAVLFEKTEKWTVYPMDYYAQKSLGPWTPNHK